MTYADAVKDFMSLNPRYKDEAYGFVLQKWAMFKNGLICDRYITDREDKPGSFHSSVRDMRMSLDLSSINVERRTL